MKQKQIQLPASSGFTLLELLVVVSILATIAGIGVGVVGNYLEKAQQELVHTEMKNIGNAIVKFNQDTGYFPGEGPFKLAQATEADKLDLSFLFFSPRQEQAGAARAGAEILPWSEEAGRGWNGPYLNLDAIDYLRTSGCGELQAAAQLQVFPVSSPARAERNGIIALADPFKKAQTAGTDNCFISRSKQQGWALSDYIGSAYQYTTEFRNDRYLECPESGAGCIALLSAGKNGRYENGNNDDQVSVLRIN